MTVHEILTNFATQAGPVDWPALEAALTEREDEMRDRMQMAGVQFGLMPFIVAAVLMDVGLGTPPTDEEKQLIIANYNAGMQALIEGRQPPGSVD